MIGRLQEILGADAEGLLSHQCKTIAKESLHLPGPDFIDRASFGQLACEVLGLDPKTVEAVTTDVQAQTAARRPLLGGLKAERLFELTDNGVLLPWRDVSST